MTAAEPRLGPRDGGRRRVLAWLAAHRGGLVLAATVALAASFLASHYGAPAMLFALLLGMGFNFLAADPRTGPGIDFASTDLLRFGVALLGLRLTFADIQQLGVVAIVGVAGLVVLTLGGGVVIARAFGRPAAFGLLTGGAVAICGASAALAIAAILPPRRISERDVLLTVVGVTALSTVAMVLYPALFAALGLTGLQSGYLIGATIHDVAQVVGAGYSIGEDAGDIATFTKLLRVSLLPLVLLAAGLCCRGDSGAAVRLPWFVVAFLVLMLARNLLPLPAVLVDLVGDASQFVLLTAIAALGVRTSLGSMVAAGPQGLAIMALQTLWLLSLATGFLLLVQP